MSSHSLSTTAIIHKRDVDLTKLAGPQLVTVLLAWGALGVLSTQVYTYSQAFPKDRVATKYLVYAIYILEVIQLLLLTTTMFKIFAAGFGDIFALIQVDTLWFSVFVMEGIVTFAVQLYYGWRIAIISGSKIPGALILVMSLTSLVFSTVIGARVKIAGSFDVIFSQRNDFTILMVWAASIAICDITIAGCMTYYYLNSRIPTGDQFKHVSSIVNGIVRSVIAIGIFSACAAIINVALLATTTKSGLSYVCPIAVLSGVHSSALLALLNGRIRKYVLVKSHSTDWSAGNVVSKNFATLDGMGDRDEQLQGRDGSENGIPGPGQ